MNPLTLLIAFLASYYFLGTKLSILIPTLISAVVGLVFITKFLSNFSDINFNDNTSTLIVKTFTGSKDLSRLIQESGISFLEDLISI